MDLHLCPGRRPLVPFSPKQHQDNRQQRPHHDHDDTKQKPRPRPHERYSDDSSRRPLMRWQNTNEHAVLVTYRLDMYLIARNVYCLSRSAKKLQKSPPYYYSGAFLMTNTTYCTAHPNSAHGGRGLLIYPLVLVKSSLAICIGNANCGPCSPLFSIIYDRYQQSARTSGKHPTVRERSICAINCG